MYLAVKVHLEGGPGVDGPPGKPLSARPGRDLLPRTRARTFALNYP